MKNHRLILLFCFLLACLSGAFIANNATANDSQDVSITIAKYGLVDDEKINAATTGEPTLVTDNFGNQVQAVSGIEYTFDLVRATGKTKPVGADATTYGLVTDEQARHFQGKTDQQGMLAVGTSSGLTRGLYVVRELPNKKLAKTMPPVIVNLTVKPKVPKADSDHIVIYPKSSLGDTDDVDVKPIATEPNAPLTQNDDEVELPETEGETAVAKTAKTNKPAISTMTSLKNSFPTTGMGWVELMMRIILATSCFTLVALMVMRPKSKKYVADL